MRDANLRGADPVGVVERVGACQRGHQGGVVLEVQGLRRDSVREGIARLWMVGERTDTSAALEQLGGDETAAVAEGPGHDVDGWVHGLSPVQLAAASIASAIGASCLPVSKSASARLRSPSRWVSVSIPK